MSSSVFYFLGFCACLVIASVSIALQSQPSSGNMRNSDTAFSLQRAYNDLSRIAAAPHSIGTIEHKNVMKHIVATARAAGLITRIQNTTVVRRAGGNLMVADVNNIIAIKKGRDSSKAVLVMAHYDSEPNTFGAADDGAAVASMLETGRILNLSHQLQNDIIFLFTDGEERGLMGARAFADESGLMERLGIVLNFEARGNSGIPMIFEVSSGNAWAVNQYIKAACHPFANSLSFEIYKRLPNNTDFSIFKEAGITGLNSAFIEGYVNYHSMTDNSKNLNSNTFRLMGENMLSLVKHFGNIDINQPRLKEASYFNLLGSAMVYYPADWNWLFILFTTIMVITFFVKSYREAYFKPSMVFVGVGIFIVLIVAVLLLSVISLKVIEMLSPINNRFYSANTYNSYYCFLWIAILSLSIFTLAYGLLRKCFDLRSLAAGAILFETLVMLVFFVVVPTASYFLAFPLMGATIGNLLAYKMENASHLSNWKAAAILVLFSLPALLIMSPFIYLTFAAFGLTNLLLVAALMLCLLIGMLLPLIVRAIAVNRYQLFKTGVAALVVVGGLAVYKGQFSRRQPFRTDLRYVANIDSLKAYWVSNFLYTDKWNQQFLSRARVQSLDDRTNDLNLVSEAPLLDFTPSGISFQQDTLDGLRRLRLFINPSKDVSSIRLSVWGGIKVVRMNVNRKICEFDGGIFENMIFLNPSEKGVAIQLDLEPALKLRISVTDVRIGIPSLQGFKDLPDDIIHGLTGNSTEVTKSHVF